MPLLENVRILPDARWKVLSNFKTNVPLENSTPDPATDPIINLTTSPAPNPPVFLHLNKQKREEGHLKSKCLHWS